ncbi:MAG TPA: universal stress protein [Solirubrobacteraceae bacterium]|nr:universal stress protein [Solirubrobacteraceae bacterium]
MKEILVVANRTLGGEKLLDAVRKRASSGDTRFRLVVPQTKPSSGLVIYDEAVRESAQVRVDLALSTVAAEGIAASGEVGDGDPFLATMDAVAENRPDEIIVSTHPATHSGWLRRDLIARIANASGLPVDHIVVDLDQEGLPFRVTLVVAHKTSSGEELIEYLKRKAAHGGQHLFIAVVPQLDGSGDAPREARERLAKMLDRLSDAGLVSSGMIGDPDPYTAVMNALELFRVDDVVISTLPGERSGWLRSNLIERVQGSASVPVEHVVVDPQAQATAAPAA